MRRKTKRQLADEAYHRMEAALGTENLPGQLDIDGSIVGERPDMTRVWRNVDGVPPACPGCERAMMPSDWTPMTSLDTMSDAQGHLQCGSCGEIIGTTAEALEQVRLLVRARFAASGVKPPKRARAPRQRGAG